MFYKRLLDNYPIPTKMATSGFLFGLGDFVCQTYVQKTKSFDYARLRNLSVTGCFYAAPVLHTWYCIGLPKIISFTKNRNTFERVAKMIALDQTVFASSFLCGFYMFLNYLQHGNLSSGVKALQEKFKETMLANWTIWPAAMTFNFWLVPLQYQVLYANVVGLFWNVILSFIANKKPS